MKDMIALLFVCASVAFSGCVSYSGTTGGTDGQQSRVQMVDCGNDRECFEENMKTCTPSRFTYTLGEEEDLRFSMESLSEVRGIEGEKCVVYGKVISLEFSEDIPEEYTDLFADLFTDLEGKDMTCRIPLDVISGEEDTLSTMSPDRTYCEGSYVDAMEEFMEEMQSLETVVE
jgi:hypothetical protein